MGPRTLPSAPISVAPIDHRFRWQFEQEAVNAKLGIGMNHDLIGLRDEQAVSDWPVLAISAAVTISKSGGGGLLAARTILSGQLIAPHLTVEEV